MSGSTAEASLESQDQVKTPSGLRRFGTDLRVLWHLLVHRVDGKTHEDRLDGFYAGQAGDYDSFRSRLLHGRRELIESIDFPENAVWADLGCGTGINLEFAGNKVANLGKVHCVDLSKSLLSVTDQRIAAHGWDHVQTHHADATRVELPPGSVDVVTMSYSLTMIPNWFDAILHAEKLLRPGGTLAVVDFFVSQKHVDDDSVRHGWLRRAFWTHWFAADNVFLSGDHLAMIRSRFDVVRLEQRLGKVPYMPLIRAPYYLTLAKKRPPVD